MSSERQGRRACLAITKTPFDAPRMPPTLKVLRNAPNAVSHGVSKNTKLKSHEKFCIPDTPAWLRSQRCSPIPLSQSLMHFSPVLVQYRCAFPSIHYRTLSVILQLSSGYMARFVVSVISWVDPSEISFELCGLMICSSFLPASRP